MNTYCLLCKKDTRNIDPKVIKTKNNRKMTLSKCSICNNKSLHLPQSLRQSLVLWNVVL